MRIGCISGATSQDIVDTGLMIQLQQALALLQSAALAGVAALLALKAAEFANLPIPAHTRFPDRRADHAGRENRHLARATDA